jgi:hypothetical protein
MWEVCCIVNEANDMLTEGERIVFIALMMEVARTSETSVDIQLRTRQYIPEDSELQSRAVLAAGDKDLADGIQKYSSEIPGRRQCAAAGLQGAR